MCRKCNDLISLEVTASQKCHIPWISIHKFQLVSSHQIYTWQCVCVRAIWKLLRFSLVLIDLTVERISCTHQMCPIGMDLKAFVFMCNCREQQSANVEYRIKRYTLNSNCTLSSPSYFPQMDRVQGARRIHAKFYLFISRHVNTKYPKHLTVSTDSVHSQFGAMSKILAWNWNASVCE